MRDRLGAAARIHDLLLLFLGGRTAFADNGDWDRQHADKEDEPTDGADDRYPHPHCERVERREEGTRVVLRLGRWTKLFSGQRRVEEGQDKVVLGVALYDDEGGVKSRGVANDGAYTELGRKLLVALCGG